MVGLPIPGNGVYLFAVFEKVFSTIAQLEVFAKRIGFLFPEVAFCKEVVHLFARNGLIASSCDVGKIAEGFYVFVADQQKQINHLMGDWIVHVGWIVSKLSNN